MSFKQLPVMHNAAGTLRKVGFELEYGNVGIEESVQLIQELYGGIVHKKNRFVQKVTGTRLGDFTVEFDSRFLSEKIYKQPFDKFNINLQDIKLGEGTLEDGVETLLESIIGKLFPYEIATPPVPCTQLEQFEQLRQALYEHHAKGTESFPTNVYGTHLNVELPATDSDTIRRFLQAFLLLYPWLLEAGETDLARRLSPFIDPFPAAYATLLLDASYRPDLDTLIEDYHLHNPDRNRPLDLYPLFAALREEQVNQYTNLGKVKPREAFHYRLPNSSISRPDWTLAQEWNLWVTVEELANDPERIGQMITAYQALKEDTLIGFSGKWAKQTEQWLL